MKSLFPVVAAVLGFTLAAHAEPATGQTEVSEKATEIVGSASGGLVNTPGKAAAAAKAAAPAVETPAKPVPMYRRVGGIDLTARTITYTTKKGVKGVEKITDKTVIMQGDKPAILSDIKVGDMVSGLHLKTGENEFEILKVTKFGPAEPKIKASDKTEKQEKD